MKKQSLFYGILCLLFLFVNQQAFSQEKDVLLKNLVADYIQLLKEKNILGETDDGEKIDPGVIIDGLNWLYLPQGITIFLPVVAEERDLSNFLGDKEHYGDLGGCRWLIWHDGNIFVFEDSGM